MLIACAACGPRDAAPLVGTSSARGEERAHAPDAAAPPTAPAIPRDFRTTFTKASRSRFVSRGHLQDRFTVDVYMNATAASAFTGTAAFPPGAMLVKEQFDRATGAPAGALAMEKREPGYDVDASDWRWIAIGTRGELLREGKIDACAACHRESSHDFVFRVVD
jgi:hypothetical protein